MKQVIFSNVSDLLLTIKIKFSSINNIFPNKSAMIIDDHQIPDILRNH